MAGLRGPTSKEKRERRKRGKGRRERKGSGRKERDRPPSRKFLEPSLQSTL